MILKCDCTSYCLMPFIFRNPFSFFFFKVFSASFFLSQVLKTAGTSFFWYATFFWSSVERFLPQPVSSIPESKIFVRHRIRRLVISQSIRAPIRDKRFFHHSRIRDPTRRRIREGYQRFLTLYPACLLPELNVDEQEIRALDLENIIPCYGIAMTETFMLEVAGCQFQVIFAWFLEKAQK